MNAPSRAPLTPSTLVDYAKSLDCIHCGLCLNSCPTYRLTGVESSSPRGRIHLMRALAERELEPEPELVEELDFCLLCRNCESVCPSGVHFGGLMEFTRDALQREGHAHQPWPVRFALGAVLPRRWALSWSTRLARALILLGLWRIFFTHLGRRGRLLADMPAIPPGRERRLLPARTPAEGAQLATAAVLEGCVMPALYGRVNRATVAVLARAGCEVLVPRGHACCGSLHAHNGDLDGARRLAQATIEAFEPLRAADGAPAPVVINSAGCGAHMKEYAHLFTAGDPWHARAEAFARRVVDLSEFVEREPVRAALRARLQPVAGLGTVTYDDPCHLCHAQGIRKEPRRALDAVPGLARVELADSELCCGSAGLYAMLRPADAERVFEPKLAALQASDAATLVVANPGCQMQWETGLHRARSPVRVLHLAEVLELATRAAAP